MGLTRGTVDRDPRRHPDVFYFDNTELPLGQAGLDIVAQHYNANFARHGDKLDAVVNAKHMTPQHATALVEDIERGVATGIRHTLGRPIPVLARGTTAGPSPSRTDTRQQVRSSGCCSTS